MTQPLRIALADDEAPCRELYRLLFARQTSYELVGEAADGQAAVDLYCRLQPDIMLMDLKMPRLSGAEAIRQICQADPGACVIALTTFTSRDYIVAALRAGAAGYLVKDSSPTEVGQALREAMAGELPLSPAVRRALVDDIRGTGPPPKAPYLTITNREQELLNYLAQGLSNREIASQVHISEGTVKQYLIRIGEKLQAHSRVQILIRTLQLGLVDLPG